MLDWQRRRKVLGEHPKRMSVSVKTESLRSEWVKGERSDKKGAVMETCFTGDDLNRGSSIIRHDVTKEGEQGRKRVKETLGRLLGGELPSELKNRHRHRTKKQKRPKRDWNKQDPTREKGLEGGLRKSEFSNHLGVSSSRLPSSEIGEVEKNVEHEMKKAERKETPIRV